MSATVIEAPPDDSNRLGLALFLALILHLMVVLGVTFEVVSRDRPAQVTLDVTWVREAPALPDPEWVEHIAPEAQAGSGEAQETRAARSPVPVLVPDVPAEPMPAEATPPPEPTPAAPPQESVTAVPMEPVAQPAPRELETKPEPVPEPALDRPDPPSAALLMARGLEAARAAPAETPATQLGRAPRTHYLDTLAARAAPEAAYLEAWIRKVERVGNLNYPDEARRQGLSGTLVLSVRLDAEGRLLDVALTQSSGEPVLDQAAIRIVELAQPFSAFTDDMRDAYDQLVITRTWAFRRDRVERVR